MKVVHSNTVEAMDLAWHWQAQLGRGYNTSLIRQSLDSRVERKNSRERTEKRVAGDGGWSGHRGGFDTIGNTMDRKGEDRELASRGQDRRQ